MIGKRIDETMNKYPYLSQTFVLFFFLIFLSAPIYVYEYVATEIELAIQPRWLFFGGSTILVSEISKFMFSIGLIHSHGEFFGQLLPSQNFVFLFFISSLGALVGTGLLGRLSKSDDVFYSFDGLKLVIGTILRAALAGMLINFCLQPFYQRQSSIGYMTTAM